MFRIVEKINFTKMELSHEALFTLVKRIAKLPPKLHRTATVAAIAFYTSGDAAE
jgi:hypothetical protein